MSSATAPPPSPWDWQPSQPMRRERSVGLLRLEGPDSLRFLHGQSSQAILGAATGARLLTCCLNATARVLALTEVLVEETGASLVITAGDASAVRTALDRVLFPADRVELGPLQEARLLTPIGPSQRELPQAPEGRWERLAEGGGLRLGESVLLGPEDALPAELASLPPLGPIEAERWRLQRGEPAAPGELNGETNPFELGLADRVSLSKGCYVGQETLARLATYDGVKQQLRRWSWPAADTGGTGMESDAAVGAPLHGPEGQRVGRITSALTLPDGSCIGLALVRRAALEESRLQAGEDGATAWLSLSLPLEFVAPPVGAGGG